MSGFAPPQARQRQSGGPVQDGPTQKALSAPDRATINGEVMEFDPPVIAPVDPWTELAEILLGMLAPQPTVQNGNGASASSLDPAAPTAGTPARFDDGSDFEDRPLTAETPPPVPLDQVRPPPGDPAYEVLAGKQPRRGAAPLEVPEFPEAKGKEIPVPAGSDGGPAISPAPPAPLPAPEKPAPSAGSPKAIVAQWQGGVAGAGGAIPKPKVGIPAGAAADLSAKKDQAKERNAKAREGLVDEAKKVAPKPPVVENPPPPPPENPIPFETAMILAVSGKRLPDQAPPVFTSSPRVLDDKEPLDLVPSEPTAGERPVPSDLFQVLITPGADKIAQIDPAAKDAKGQQTPEARQVELALKQLSGTSDKKAGQERGEPVMFQDLGPEPAPPLPEGLQIPVGQVVARLLAQTDKTAASVLDTLREKAYPKGVLKTEFPEIGSGLLGSLTTEVGTELNDIAAAASVSKEQLGGMIDERRKELAKTSGEATKETEVKGKEAAEAVRDEGQKTADGVAAAAKAAEEETLRRQEAAGGATDPAVINRRRDLVMGWVREQVTVQTSNYQHAGEKRVGEVNQAKGQMLPAYTALVQRLIYKIMTPTPQTDGRKARDPTDKAREQRLADDSNVLSNWQDGEAKRIGEEVRKAVKLANDTTAANRKAVEGAGDRALDAARRWAEGRILEGKSFWDRFVALIEGWLSDADTLNEQWRVRRTRENRDAVAGDLAAVEAARKRLAEGLTQDEILADATLTEAQRLVIQQFFALPAGSSPLDFAAARLQQTIAAGHLDAVRPVFEQELIATPVSKGDYTTVKKLNNVAQAMYGGFDGAKIAQQVHGAMDQIGTDEDLVFSSLKGLSSFGGMVVRKFYTAMFGGSLDADLEDELSDNVFSEGGDLSRAKAELNGKTALADALALHDAVAGLGTDEAAIMSLLRNKTPEEVEAIRAEYLAKFGETLDTALADDLSEGNEIDQANALLSGDTATADAIGLDEAMRGGITGWGTGEADIEKVQTTIRDEVMARARAENWTSQQAEAEVRRRMKAVESKFGERYKDVEQYNEPGLTGGSVLKRAFASELSGSELDLANALQDNDLIKADAARIEIERTGFYASDEKLVKVMRSQYERALEARRLDEGPARQMRIEREVDAWRDQKPPLSEEEISRKRMALERQMERELDQGAQKDSKVATEALRSAYEGTYNRNLAYTLAFNMSGSDMEVAQALLKQGGKLSPLQEIDFATKGDGTDEEMLKKTFSSLTRAEIEEVRKQWEAAHPGEDFYAMLHSELSGRDESDIMDMAYHGAPESAKERIAQEKRRVDREQKDLTGPLGRSVSGSENSWMAYQLKELQALNKDLDRTDWPLGPEGKAQREELMGKVDFQVQRVQDAVEDHRRRIDSYTDAATQVVGIVVGVAVAIILGAVSGGTLGVATIAFISSLYATTATIATKMLFKGGAYGIEEYGIDLAVGAVDALTAVATAGMGQKLLGPMKNLLTKTKIGNLASAIGKSGLAQKAMGAPGLGKGLAFAGKLLPSPATLEKGAAKFMAESAENAIGAIPSTFTQMALTDSTWQGDPLMNFLEGGGMSVLQAVAMGHLMSGGMELGGHAFNFGRGKLRMGSEVGRLLEASRLFSDGYGKFHESNPGTSMGDFLSHPEGRKLRAELDSKGLLPTIDSVNRKLAADPTLKAAAAFDPAPPDAPMKAAELRNAQLTAALPDTARHGAFVTPDPSLTGNAVHVEPLRIGDRIVGVDVRVGPDATPLDIAMHGATIDAMQKYRGMLGSIRHSLENAGAILTGSGLTVGSKGWEARLEMAKLPAIIDARIEALSGTALTAEMRAKTLADIESLDRQFHEHQAVFHDATQRGQEGKGYVAAEDSKAKGDVDEAAGKVHPDKTRDLQTALQQSDVSGDYRRPMALLDALSAETGLAHETLVSLAERQHGGDGAKDPTTPEGAKRIALLEKRARAVEVMLDYKTKAQKLHDAAGNLTKTPAEIAGDVQADLDAVAPKGPKKAAPKAEAVGIKSDGLAAPDAGELDALRAQKFNLDDKTATKIGKMLDAALRLPDGSKAQEKALAATGKELHAALTKAGVTPHETIVNAALADLLAEVQSPQLKRGRRDQAEATIKKHRGGKELEGFVLDTVLAENVQALNELRNDVAVLKPDMVFGVREGGAVLVEALVEPGKPRPNDYQIIEKGPKGERTPELRKEIVKAINGDPPKLKFAIIDSYMGGGAASEFIDMWHDIVRAHPNVEGLHLELLWLRETHGFERLLGGTAPGEPKTLGLEPQKKIPPEDAKTIAQTTKPIRMVLGDDMDVVYAPDARDPIKIFDRKGELVKIIMPPVENPLNPGQILTTTRQIMIALMQGAEF